MCGIITFRQDHVAQAQSVEVEYEDDDRIQVARMGAVWVDAGSAVEFNGLVVQDRSDWQWDALTVPAAFGDLVDFPIYNASFQITAANQMMAARIGYGRVK